jgi:hypothetical protein
MKLKKYDHFLILEKFDDNITKELIRLGVTDKSELDEYVKQSHRGNLATYLGKSGKDFTFGLLHAIFLDAQEAKRKTDFRTGVIKMAHRLIPMALAPFYPIMAIVGYILGTSRAFNKVIAPILADPGKNYPDFLRKLVEQTMKVAEGEVIPTKDRFARAFVVDGSITDMIKEDVLFEFTIHLSDKMSKEDPDKIVPDHYIENQLRKYLNRRFDIDPPFTLK